MTAWLERPIQVRIGIIVAILFGGLLFGLLGGYTLGYHHGVIDMMLLDQL